MRHERRLLGFWGAVDRRHNDEIARRIRSGPVLDLGCGYGTLTEYLTGNGVDIIGVDADPASLAIARERCPAGSLLEADAAELPFTDGSFDTIVMRDSLHHLVGEGDWARIRTELLRVLSPTGRIVVFDPNVIGILRLARALVRHRDEVCTVDDARRELAGMGLRVVEVSYNTVFTLPISGGYVGARLVPDRPRRLHSWLLRLEIRTERLLKRFGLLKRVAWRYLVVAER